MPRKKKEIVESVIEPVVETATETAAVKKPKRAYKRKKKTVEEITPINAIVIAPKLSMCDGKKKRLEKAREQNGVRNI
jgi:hypothetical protein